MATAQHEIGKTEGPATFESVWEMFQEIGRKQAETARGLEEMREASKATDRQMEKAARRMEATDRQIEATDRQMEKTARQMEATDKRVGALTNRYGEIAEHMIVPNLVSSFNALGYTFDKTNHDTKVEDFKHGIFTEADAFLENGDSVMVVEIKTKLRTDHIDDHVKRMEKFRARADLHNDQRKYYGAIAGLLMSESEKAYALKKGFYVLKPVGETFTIITPQSGAPKAW